MLFPTVAFALFFIVAFSANWLLRPFPLVWRCSMVGLSFFFYGYWNVKFTLLLAASILGNWAAARALGAKSDRDPDLDTRPIVIGAVVGNLAVLGFFKYYGFFATSVTDLFSAVGIGGGPPLIEVLLPVGISFFTFQAMSYVIDVDRGTLDRPMPLLDTAFFLSFFPQLVAGPIVRAVDMADQIARPPDPRRVPVTEATGLIIGGLFKKVVVSSYLAAEIVDPVFAVPGDHSRFEVLLAIYGYAIQIYADFSGYTDIAIGCALLLGFRFPQNFNQPYRAESIQDFWRRWHITLSTWLRDYLYIPLGGNRGGTLLTYRNLWLTMVLGGLWHGAAWNFVIWGAIHGTALGIERFVTQTTATRRAETVAVVNGDQTAGAGVDAKQARVGGPVRGGMLGDESSSDQAIAVGDQATRSGVVAGTRGGGSPSVVEPDPGGLPPQIGRAVRWFVTFHVVCLAWIFFRASDSGIAFDMLGTLFSGGSPVAGASASLISPLLIGVIAVAIASQFIPREFLREARLQFAQLPLPAQMVIVALAMTAIDAFGPEGVAPFIYFQF